MLKNWAGIEIQINLTDGCNLTRLFCDMDWHKNTLTRTSPLKNEAALLLQVAAGNEMAFEKVFYHYNNRIYSYAFHLFGNNSLADELVQDVFLKVWLNRAKIPEILKFSDWLFIITRNQVFDTLKMVAKEDSARRQLAHSRATESNSTEEQLLIRENEQRLHHALNRLSPQQKLIFTLSRHQGMKHEEIASRLNISRNTVKTHLVHALRTLRDSLSFQSDGLLLFLLFLQFLLKK
jgi:RNA polymerase sigma-70 factor (family 1)